MATIEINAIECESMHDAIQTADATGRGEPVLCGGKPVVVPQADLDRLEAAGVAFAHLYSRRMPDGSYRIVTVPNR